MKNRYREAYKKGFQCKLQKLLAIHRNIILNFGTRARCHNLKHLSKKEISNIICLVFGSSWKRLIDFQLSHNYLFISNKWFQFNLTEFIKMIKKHGVSALIVFSITQLEFNFLISLNEKEI